MDLLAEINQTGITVLVVTHDPEVAARTQRTIRLHDGKVVDARARARGNRAASSACQRDRRRTCSRRADRRRAHRRSARRVARVSGAMFSFDRWRRGLRHDPPQQAAHRADRDQRRVGHLRDGRAARPRATASTTACASSFRARGDERRSGSSRARRASRTPATTIGRKLTFDNRDYDRATQPSRASSTSPASYFIKGGQFGGGEMIDAARRQGEHVRDQRGPPRRDLSSARARSSRAASSTRSDIAQRRKSAVIGRPVARLPVPARRGSDRPVDRGRRRAVPGRRRLHRRGRRGAGAPDLHPGVDRAARVLRRRPPRHADVHRRRRRRRRGQGDHRARSIGQLAERHQFSPDDPQAVRVHDNVESYERFQQAVLDDLDRSSS